MTRPGSGDAGNPSTNWVYAKNYSPTGSSSVNTAGLNAAIQKQLSQQGQSSGSVGAGATLNTMPGFSFSYNSATDPLYNFELQQGTNAITSQASALGGINSGATLKALQSYGQNTAENSYQQEYSNALNAYNENLNAFNTNQNSVSNLYNRLMGMSSLGENAAAGVGNAAISTGNSLANNMIGAGNASAAGTVGSANALSGGLTSLLNNQAFLNAFSGNGNPLFDNNGYGVFSSSNPWSLNSLGISQPTDV